MLKSIGPNLPPFVSEQSGAKEPFIAQVVRMTEIQELEIAAMYQRRKG